jgi:hypothetical protein
MRMKFKVEITVEFNDFVIPPNKSQSMNNAMQREQVWFAIHNLPKNDFFAILGACLLAYI